MVVHGSGELHDVEAEQREPYARHAEAEPCAEGEGEGECEGEGEGEG